MPLRPGTTIGGYRLERVIGAGGMGVVYQATQLSLDRTVALKVLADDYRLSPAFRERFRREAIAQAALDHTSIVPIYEADERDGHFFLAMRYIRGLNLKELVYRSHPDPQSVVRLLEQVANALDAAHAVGLVHRDVKPQNVLVEGTRAYLADFGLTRATGDRALTGTGQQFGTLDYMSPEQIKNRPATYRSDIYSLGALTYECLAGEVPFPRETEVAVMYAHLEDEPPSVHLRRPEVPTAVDAAVATAMAKDPAARQNSATQLVAEVAAAIGIPLMDAPEPQHPPRREVDAATTDIAMSAARLVARPQGRRRRVAGVALAVVLLTAGLAAGALVKRAASSSSATKQTTTTLQAGFASVRLSSGWQRSTESYVPSLHLRDVHTLADGAGKSRTVLVLGVQTNGSPTSPPRGFRTLAHSVSVRASSDLPGYVFEGSPAAIQTPDLFRAYVFPTTLGRIIALCRSSRAAESVRCARVVATVSSAAPSLDRANGDFARRLDHVLGRLAGRRRRDRVRLALATNVDGRAHVARQLSGLYAQAALAVAHLHGRTLEAGGTMRIARALRSTAAAYRKLAQAAADPPRFAGAARSVARSDRTLRFAIQAFSRLGYRVLRTTPTAASFP